MTEAFVIIGLALLACLSAWGVVALVIWAIPAPVLLAAVTATAVVILTSK